MKRYLIFFIFLQLFFDGVSQTPNMNDMHTKYWFYRWRLRNDFMVMGSESGQSLVMQARNPERKPCIQFGDATIMHGYYLSMLAIENRLLQEMGRNEDLNNNRKELYYAIKAFERVDYFSETVYSSVIGGNNDDYFRVNDIPQRPDVNGFFIRDDVHPTFLNLTPGTGNNFTANYFKLNNGKTGINYGALGVNYNVSDYSSLWVAYDSDPGPDEYFHLNPPLLDQPKHPIVNFKEGRQQGEFGLVEESQDQIIRLFLGFVTIVKSIPDITYQIDLDGDGIFETNMNFNDEAQRHATNLIGRMCQKFSGTSIVDPVNVATIPYIEYSLPPFPWNIMNPRHNQTWPGGYVGPYKPPMQLISEMLFTLNNDLEITNSSYAYEHNSGLFNAMWNTGTGVGFNDNVNAKMALNMIVASNSGNSLGTTVPRALYEESVGSGSNVRNHQGYYVPFYDYLWGWEPNLSTKKGQKDAEKKQAAYDRANYLLSVAPCVGPHNFGYSHSTICESCPLPDFSPDQYVNDGVPEIWNTHFLFDAEYSKYSDGMLGEDNHGFEEGWFSGVDFMLLYNIIYANADYERPMYHDLINRVVDYEINTDNVTQLTEYSGANKLIGAFENLKISNKIFGNSKVEIKSLDYILLENGTELDPLSSGELYVYNDKITCTNGLNTSYNTPYQLDICPTCNLEENIGSKEVPTVNKRVYSLETEVPVGRMEDLISLTELQELKDSDVLIYPNPAIDFFTIISEEKIVKIEIYNSAGSFIKSFEDISENYSIEELSKGIYLIVIYNENNSIYNEKLVKN